MTPEAQQVIDAAFEMMAATKKAYPQEGTPEFFALTNIAHRLECACLAYKRSLVAAPMGREGASESGDKEEIQRLRKIIEDGESFVSSLQQQIDRLTTK